MSSIWYLKDKIFFCGGLDKWKNKKFYSWNTKNMFIYDINRKEIIKKGKM